MNVFKLALKVAARHWNYLLIYMVALGAMSLLGSGAIEVAPQGEFKADSPKVAVIDRDGTDVSAALSAFALKDAEEVHVDDSTFGLQDASAKDLASYVLIIPEGFQGDLLAAARTGGDAPELQTVISYQSARGSLVDQRVRGFAQSLYGFAASDATASAADVARSADKACANETPVGFLAVDSQGLSAKYVNYAAFSAYALFAASSIFIAVGLSSLRRGALRRRLVLGPVPSGRYGLQVGLACALFSVAIWAVIAAAGLVAFNPLGQGAPLAAVCGACRAAGVCPGGRRGGLPYVAAWRQRHHGQRRGQYLRPGVQLLQRRLDSAFGDGRKHAPGRGVHAVLLGHRRHDASVGSRRHHGELGAASVRRSGRDVRMGRHHSARGRSPRPRTPARKRGVRG